MCDHEYSFSCLGIGLEIRRVVPGIKKKSVHGIIVLQKDMGEVEAMGKNGGSIKKSSTENRVLGNIHMQE